METNQTAVAAPPPSEHARSDVYDTPWKAAMIAFFIEFMAFYFPEVHAKIDWERRFQFLDTELEEVTPDAVVGKRFVDKLVQVYLKDGRQDWICIHVEVQGRRQTKFTKRMFAYYYRILDRFDRPVASMAVLADNDPAWRPTQFQQRMLGCNVTMDFLAAKLTDFKDDIPALLEHPNPFALVTAAHLLTQRTRGNVTARYEAKLMLLSLLGKREWEKERIMKLVGVIDWLLYLPKELNEKLRTEVRTMKGAKMEYVTSFERIAEEEGWKKGCVKTSTEMLLMTLATRFGEASRSMADKVMAASAEQVMNWFKRALVASTLDDVFRETSA